MPHRLQWRKSIGHQHRQNFHHVIKLSSKQTDDPAISIHADDHLLPIAA